MAAVATSGLTEEERKKRTEAHGVRSTADSHRGARSNRAPPHTSCICTFPLHGGSHNACAAAPAACKQHPPVGLVGYTATVCLQGSENCPKCGSAPRAKPRKCCISLKSTAVPRGGTVSPPCCAGAFFLVFSVENGTVTAREGLRPVRIARFDTPWRFQTDNNVHFATCSPRSCRKWKTNHHVG